EQLLCKYRGPINWVQKRSGMLRVRCTTSRNRMVYPSVCASVGVHTVDIIRLVHLTDSAGKDRPVAGVDGIPGRLALGIYGRASGRIVIRVQATLALVAHQLRI